MPLGTVLSSGTTCLAGRFKPEFLSPYDIRFTTLQKLNEDWSVMLS
jgi:hypothetical protein